MKYTVKASVMCVATTSLTTRPHITYQGCTILSDYPFDLQMQCGKKEVFGLRIQAIDAMDSFIEPCKRERSCSVTVQRASISSVTCFLEF